MLDWRDQEVINQTVFREMNEWTMEAREGDRVATLTNSYLCECSDCLCTAPIELKRAEYEAVRAVPINFAIAVNHENPEVDNVVVEHDRFAVVEKIGAAATGIARATDPRR